MSNSKCCEVAKQNIYVSQKSGSLSPVVEKCLSHIIEKEGFIFCDVNVKDISTNGGNYLATLQELDLKGKSANGDKEINLFLKNKVIAEDFNIFSLEEVYNKEAFYYNELAKIYNRLQDDANIPDEERFRIAKSYGESNADVTILDNLCKKGYKPFDRLESVTYDFAEKSIKQMAKFHCLSFALKSKMPEYFDKTIKPIRSPFRVDSNWKEFMGGIFDSAIVHLQGEAREKLKNILPTLIESYRRFIESDDSELNCLCHGDLRPNNVMTLKKGGKIEDLILVDFQLINYGRLVADFVYFIFTGSDQDFRRAHLEYFKEFYYETFSKFLKHFGIFAEDVYPLKCFHDDFYEYLDFGLICGLMLCPFLFCDEDDIPEINTIVNEPKFSWNDKAIKRWRELADDYISWKNM